MLGDIQVITSYIVFQGQHVVSAKKVPGQPELHEILPFLPKKSKMDNHELNNKPLLSLFHSLEGSNAVGIDLLVERSRKTN